MYYVYLLVSSKDNNFYTGYSSDLKKRFKAHNSGRCLSTKHRRPFELVYYEACLNEFDAKSREKYLKSGMGKRYLRNRLAQYLQGHKL